jgi:hypothetical protein
MNEYDSTPDAGREWVPADLWQDDDEPNLLAAAVEAEANYAYEG